jgi:hypothetical protein
MTPEIGDNHRASSQPVAGAKEMDNGFSRHVVSHLAQQHHIYALVPNRRRPGASHRRDESGCLGKGGSGPVELQPDRHDPNAASITPAHGNLRQIA